MTGYGFVLCVSWRKTIVSGLFRLVGVENTLLKTAEYARFRVIRRGPDSDRWLLALYQLFNENKTINAYARPRVD